MDQVTSAQLRLGITPRPKALLIMTTPASSNPWNKKTTSLTRATPAATLPAASFQWTKTVTSEYNLMTDFPELPSVKQDTTPESIPSTPLTNHP
jgi:hypothetical protein